MAHLSTLASGTRGELREVARLIVDLSRFPAISVVAALLPFWGACVERRRNCSPSPSSAGRKRQPEQASDSIEVALQQVMQTTQVLRCFALRQYTLTLTLAHR